MNINLYIFHLFVPLLIFLILKYRNNVVKKLSLLLGITIILYHSFLFYNNLKNYNFVSEVNLFHILFVSLLFIYLGLAKEISYMIEQFIYVIIYGAFILFLLKIIKHIRINYTDS